MNKKEQPSLIGRPEIQQGRSVHELGGLRPNNWRKVLNKIGTPETDIEKDISAYANHVIAGELSPDNYDARNYLGQSHWYRIAQDLPYFENTDGLLATPVKDNLLGRIDERRGIGWRKIRTFVFLPTEEGEISLFAALEKTASYGIEDYIKSRSLETRKWYIEGEPPFRVPVHERKGNQEEHNPLWETVSQQWSTRLYYRDFSPPEHGEIIGSEEVIDYATATEVSSHIAPIYDWYYEGYDNRYLYTDTLNHQDRETIRKLWLLTSDDISNEELDYTSPEALTQRLREKAKRNPEEITPILKNSQGIELSINKRLSLPRANKYPKDEILAYYQSAVQAHLRRTISTEWVGKDEISIDMK